MQSVTPYLTSRDAAGLIDFIKALFAAEELFRGTGSAGGVHCELRVGDTTVMVGGGAMIEKAMPAALHVYVDDVDASHARAVALGAKELRPPQDQDYGDRDGSAVDPFGNHWYLATPLAGAPRASELGTVTLYLHPRGTAGMIDFLARAFGAETLARHESPDGAVAHAKVRIGHSVIELGEAHAEFQPMPSMVYLEVADADAAYARALAAGSKSIAEPADQSYGARVAGVEDPFGNQWYVASPLEKR
jgi:PhnB protein